MEERELKALVSLLDEQDGNILSHVEEKILSLGEEVIPFLEGHWENSMDPLVQKRIEDIIHHLQFEGLKSKLSEWKAGDQDLLEVMYLLATYQYPDLELDKLRNDLEQIYYEAWLEFKGDAHPFDQVKKLNSVLFSKLKFSANTKNFHAPGNSMINIVLESRRGNPLSLCVLYMLVGRKLKMPLYGVNLPNLFILTYKSDDVQFYINAFNKGLIFSRADIDNYLSHLNQVPNDIFYQPCTSLDIALRLLRNLIASFENLSEHHKADEVKQLLRVLSEGREGY